MNNLMQQHGFECIFSEKVLRKYAELIMIPWFHAVFENRIPQTKTLTRYNESETWLRQYIEQSRVVDRHIRKLIHRTAALQHPVIVWGVGTHTQRLLAAGDLKHLKICAFADSNAKYHGQRLNNIPILSSASLKERKEPILVC